MKRVEERWRERVEAIAKDHTSGAAEITRRAGLMVAEFLADSNRGWNDFFELGRAIVGAQPEMASIFNLVNGLLWASGGAGQFEDRREGLSSLAVGVASRDVAPAVADALAPLVEDRGRIVTISNSSTLRKALVLLKARAVRFQVACAEGRPMFEGRDLASSLLKAGIPVRLVSDAAIYGELDGTALTVVGADAIRPKVFTNKVGTWALLLAARERNSPFYVVAEKSKFLPESIRRTPRDQEAREIWPDAPAGIQIVNCYFEDAPLDVVNGVVIEDGVLSSEAAAETAAGVEVYPGLWCTGV